MADAPVIPLKFGTYADDDGQILDILHSGGKDLAGALAKYDGKVEVDLAAFWADLASVLSEFARDQTVVSMKAQIVNPAEATTEQRVRLGQAVKKLLDERRGRIADQLVVALRTNWPGIVVNPTKDDSTILNAAILVGRNEQAQLENVIDQLDRCYEGHVNFRCVGPLPPYSFATAEVETIGPNRLDAARRMLGLGESASLAEMKGAYRRLLQEVHPDRNTEACAADRIQEITAAYDLLEEYVLNVRHTFNASLNGPVIVKVRSLDDLRAGMRGPARCAPPRRPDRLGVEAA
jgi:hypothetical protein